jgi:thiosulfate reductase cytochrome b subunit
MSSTTKSSTTASSTTATKPRLSQTIHPVWVRATHWVNVVAMVAMIGSGWRIYDASPLFPFSFPPAITLGDGLDGLPGALLWHFAAMWLLVVNGAAYVALGVLTGRFRRKLLPIRPTEVIRDLRAALTGRLSHADLTVYNAVQRLLYGGVIAAGIVAVVSGLTVWKPVQLKEVVVMLGGYDVARFVHFFAMAAIVSFLVVHVTLAILVPRSLRAMIVGR